ASIARPAGAGAQGRARVPAEISRDRAGALRRPADRRVRRRSRDARLAGAELNPPATRRKQHPACRRRAHRARAHRGEGPAGRGRAGAHGARQRARHAAGTPRVARARAGPVEHTLPAGAALRRRAASDVRRAARRRPDRDRVVAVPRGRGRGDRRLLRRNQGCRVTKIRTLVVDDEPMARERILGLLAQETDVEVVGQCADGVQAVNAIQQLSPELVFLDVQMPAVDGFGVIRQVGPEKMPMVVFVTAYAEYALQASEVHALDYLLKPFGRDRLQQCLDHARHHRDRARAGELGKSLMALVQDFKPEQKKQDRLVVKSGGRVFFVRTDDIDWIEASGNYVRLHLKEQSFLFRETMNQMESRLDPQRFFRIHRSRIVNTERIKELQPWFNGEYVVVLHNGTQLRLSRSYREKLEERLGKAI